LSERRHPTPVERKRREEKKSEVLLLGAQMHHVANNNKEIKVSSNYLVGQLNINIAHRQVATMTTQKRGENISENPLKLNTKHLFLFFQIQKTSSCYF
jgi:hypothetical protein